MLLKDFIRESVTALQAVYATKEAEKLVSLLCEEVLGVKSYTHIVEPGYEVEGKHVPRLKESMARLLDGEPLQYILGYADFGELRFNVNPSVLIPRPETMMLVNEAVDAASRLMRMRLPFVKSGSPVRVLDLCTGSGCIAWSMALEAPGVEVVAVDISGEALDVARKQPFRDMVRQRKAIAPVFVKADVLDTSADFPYGKFDIVLSNPPYILEGQKTSMCRNVLDFEPPLALFVPDEDPLLFYKAVSVWADRFLVDGGLGMVEVNEDLGPQTSNVFSAAGFHECRIRKDFYDKDRIVSFSKQSL